MPVLTLLPVYPVNPLKVREKGWVIRVVYYEAQFYSEGRNDFCDVYVGGMWRNGSGRSRASIHGVVTDKSGAVMIVAAKITLLNPGLGLRSAVDSVCPPASMNSSPCSRERTR